MGLSSLPRTIFWRQQCGSSCFDFFLHLPFYFSFVGAGKALHVVTEQNVCDMITLLSRFIVKLAVCTQLRAENDFISAAERFSPAQVQHIVTETRDKIMQYKSKMVDEADLRRRLASLEESVELHEHMKRQVANCCWAPFSWLSRDYIFLMSLSSSHGLLQFCSSIELIKPILSWWSDCMTLLLYVCIIDCSRCTVK